MRFIERTMLMKLPFKIITAVIWICIILIYPCEAQGDISLPISSNSFRNFVRSFLPVPRGRVAKLKDIRFLHFGQTSKKPSVYHYADVKRLLTDPELDFKKPTVLYIHGYVEEVTDDSVVTIVNAYRRHGGYNLLVLDWSNMSFGNYINVVLDVKAIGEETGKVVAKLLRGGLPLKGLHVVGHSIGAHIAGTCCRYLRSLGFTVPRLTCLDAAFPGFYQVPLSQPFSKKDALFVDVIHTDGGEYGSPLPGGHADFWPNGGRATQPGCLSPTVLLTLEDFCSHWRSWRYWAESLEGGQFLARRCAGYDEFLRGDCRDSDIVSMGPNVSSDVRGNFYLRTASKSPFALDSKGAE